MRNDLNFNINGCEDLWIEIEQKSAKTKKIAVGVVYRHPKQNFPEFQKRVSDTISKFENAKYEYIICGDINIIENSSHNGFSIYGL